MEDSEPPEMQAPEPIFTMNDVLPEVVALPLAPPRNPYPGQPSRPHPQASTPSSLFTGTSPKDSPPQPVTSPVSLFDATKPGGKDAEKPARPESSVPAATVTTSFALDSDPSLEVFCPVMPNGNRPTAEVVFCVVSEWSALVPHYIQAHPGAGAGPGKPQD
jgi:hypothetical protein